MSVLQTTHLSLGFTKRLIIDKLNLTIEKGSIVSILGPNGSGKSTLLKALSRNLKPWNGIVYLNGEDIHRQTVKGIAKQMATLPQSPQAPGDVTVRELVEYGRFPHQTWWKGTKQEDDEIVTWALEQTGLADMAERIVNTLSGGERQRAWIAMALAQKPQILLLDEPTTYLDISHQLEILELVSRLNTEHGITVVMVLHDMNHAAKYSTRIVVLNNGEVFASGSPAEVITRDMLDRVFGVEADIWADGEGNPVFMARGLSRKKRI